MRLIRLEFARVGMWRQPFELPLGSRVTLVLGDNEAGKSTMRRALDALLFGPNKERVAPREVIGFEFAANADAGDGAQFRLHRRGRNLSSPPPASLQSLLAPTLAGRFRDLFCLSHENLRSDDRAFLGANGAIGSLLFGASAGISPGRLSQVLNGIDEQISNVRSRTPKKDGLGFRLDMYANQRQRHLDVARFEQYQEAAQLEERAKAEQDHWVLKGRELRAEQARLQQLLDGISAFDSLDSARAEWARLQSIHQPLPLARVMPLRELWGQLAESDRQLAERQRADGEALQALEKLPEPGPLHVLAGEVDALRDAVARIDADRRELVTDSDACHAHIRELRRLLESLGAEGGSDPVAHAAALLRPAPIRFALQQLIDRHDTIASQRSEQEMSLAEAERRLKMASDKAAMLPPVDLLPIQRARTFAEAAARQETAIADHTKALRKLDADAEQLARQLGFAQPSDVERLCPRPPDRSRTLELERVLGKQRAEVEASQKALKLARKDHASRRDAFLALQARLGEMPSAERITQSRSLRDCKWLELQRYWTPTIHAGTEAALSRTAAEFEALMSLVDAQVAQRASAGELLGQWQAAEATLAAAVGKLQEVTDAHEGAVSASRESDDAWSALWSFLDAPPASAEVWFAHHDNWMAQARQRCDLRAEIDAARTQLEQAMASALAHAGASLSSLSTSSTASAVLDEIRREEKSRNESNQRAGTLQGAVQQASEALQQAQDTLDRTRSEETSWRQAWELQCASLPVGISPQTPEVRAWLGGQSELERLRKVAEELAARIGERRERVRELDQRITDLVARARTLDADLGIAPSLDARAAFDALLAITQRASERQRTRQAALDTRATAGRELERAESQCIRLVESLNALWSELGQREAPSESSINAVLGIAEESARLQQQIGTHGARLDGLWKDQRTQFEARLSTEGREALEAALNAIGRELDDTAKVINDKRQVRHEATSALRKLDESHDLLAVEQAYSESREAVLEKADELHQLLLARYLLKQAYEKASIGAGRLEIVASRYFATLTGQFYSSLRIDRDDSSGGSLKAIASNGDEKDLGELSAGTRDQIWLALRLAAIVEAARETPFPLILDDIFVHFDDERSSAALRLLAEVSEHAQVIAFTHHDHIADLAQTAIPADQLTLITLPRPDAAVRVRTLAKGRGPRERPSAPVADDAENGPLLDDGDDSTVRRDRRVRRAQATSEAAERVLLELLRNSTSSQSRDNLIQAAEELGFDLGEHWTAAIKALVTTGRVLQSGQTRAARYTLPIN